MTILVLEDEPIISIELEDILEAAGAEALTTATIAGAARLAETGPIDAAILDINIHGDYSFPVALTLRSRGIPFVFASGYDNAVHPPELRDVPTLGKPYRITDIIRALEPLREEAGRVQS